jgi:DNA polymerase-3 subunit beta
MEFTISRTALLNPLRLLTGVVERKQTLPILGNVCMNLNDGILYLTTTDSELEMSCQIAVDTGTDGKITLPALKLFDICRSLNGDAQIQFKLDTNRMAIKAGRTRFSLTYLPAEDFPSSEEVTPNASIQLPQATLKWLLAKTQFAMAQQDVRYYLNGLLLDLSAEQLNVVATDGHRLALARESATLDLAEPLQVIIPRKAVTELVRSLEDNDESVEIGIAANHIRFTLPNFTLTSKLIDGTFPEYQGVIPAMPDKKLLAECDNFKQSLNRASILSSEKYKGVRLNLSTNLLQISAHNPEQEEAEEDVDVQYSGDELEVGFNIAYLLDALNAVDTECVEMHFTEANSSCLICPEDANNVKYVIMPMRL